jgi:hypothetical protein
MEVEGIIPYFVSCVAALGSLRGISDLFGHIRPFELLCRLHKKN